MSVNEIIEWLRSPEGEKWSLDHSVNGGNAARHESGVFGSLKPDVEHDNESWSVLDTAFGMQFQRRRKR